MDRTVASATRSPLGVLLLSIKKQLYLMHSSRDLELAMCKISMSYTENIQIICSRVREDFCFFATHRGVFRKILASG